MSWGIEDVVGGSVMALLVGGGSYIMRKLNSDINQTRMEIGKLREHVDKRYDKIEDDFEDCINRQEAVDLIKIHIEPIKDGVSEVKAMVNTLIQMHLKNN